MSSNTRKVAILSEGHLNVYAAKTAVGVIRYSPNPVVAVIDSEHAGKTVQDVLGFGGSIPIVASTADALQFEPEVLIIGIAPSGGRLPDGFRRAVNEAIDAGIEVWSGLHVFLADDPEFGRRASDKNVRIWDVRKPRPDLVVGEGKALNTRALVVLAVGTDCNIGKMTVCLELQKYAREQGYKAGFVATGQTGILIHGDGTPLDAVPGDFMPGEVESLVLAQDAAGCDVIFVEGQGAITHPGFGPVTLGLMLGAMPDVYLICHQPGRTHYRPHHQVPLPSLRESVALYENLMVQYKAPKVVAAGLNTYGMNDDEAAKAAAEISAELGVPAADPIRHGSRALWEAVEPLVKQKLAGK